MIPAIVAQQPWDYTLYKADGRHILSVACGGVALYELNIPLTLDEEARVLDDTAALGALAAAIRDDPPAWAARSVALAV